MSSGASSQPKDKDLTAIAKGLQGTTTGVLKKTDTDTWALDANLYSIGAVGTPADSTFLVGNGSSWIGESGSTARASLGATTVGSNLFTLSNPSEITYLRVNADNTVSTLNTTALKSALDIVAEIDGGFANSTFLTAQLIDGGDADG